MRREVRHVPVLLDDVLSVMKLRAGMVVVDCTVGLGGHSVELLKGVMPGGRLVGIDFDAGNLERAREKLLRVGGTFDLVQNNFAALPTVLSSLGIKNSDGVLADVGVASPQIDDPARGFSYRGEGPLDMRMDRTRGKTAAELLARMSEREIAETLLELGDEEDAAEIARLVIQRRKLKPIETTQDLVAIVCEARDFTLKRAAGAKLHPAARTFQTLRILVNRELANLERLLAVLPEVLKPGGVGAIISFHSGEDRRVKSAFVEGRRLGIYEEISREPIVASEREQRENPRSRSAKLRWCRKG